MKRDTSPILMDSKIELHDPSLVLGEFQVDGNQFFIVSLETRSNTQLALDKSDPQLQKQIEVARFQVQGQFFVIVKVEQPTLEESINSALISLLTERELQVVTLVASGYVNKQIASQLHISEWTVSTHLRRIFIKLGVDSRAAMVYRCAPIIQNLRKQGGTSQNF